MISACLFPRPICLKKSPSLGNPACFSKCMVSVKLEYSASKCFRQNTWFIFTVSGYLSSKNGPSSVLNVEGAARTSACNQSCSSAGREPLQAEWAQGADDDHDARDDEFSSCGQLDPSAEEGKRARERGGRRKRDFIEEEWKNGPLKNKSSEVGSREETLRMCSTESSIWITAPTPYTGGEMNGGQR